MASDLGTQYRGLLVVTVGFDTFLGPNPAQAGSALPVPADSDRGESVLHLAPRGVHPLGAVSRDSKAELPLQGIVRTNDGHRLVVRAPNTRDGSLGGVLHLGGDLLFEPLHRSWVEPEVTHKAIVRRRYDIPHSPGDRRGLDEAESSSALRPGWGPREGGVGCALSAVSRCCR